MPTVKDYFEESEHDTEEANKIPDDQRTEANQAIDRLAPSDAAD